MPDTIPPPTRPHRDRPGRNAVGSEAAVLARYAAASTAREAQLCCPVEYDPRYLAAIPDDVLERDYGCGDPSRFARLGDTVLDLGSGGGKICFIASQIVGPRGRVIGIDFNPPMLDLARRHTPDVARRVGWENVEFRFGRIQDLGTDYAAMEAYLAANPVTDLAALAEFEAFRREQRSARPLVADASVDLVLSNCVLNLVEEDDRRQLFDEIARVLKPGGRIAISDVVADRPVPEALKRDPELWSGCIAGAFEETAFLGAFIRAGLISVAVARRDETPWRTVDGIEFRALTVTAEKPGDAGTNAAASCCVPTVDLGPRKSCC